MLDSGSAPSRDRQSRRPAPPASALKARARLPHADVKGAGPFPPRRVHRAPGIGSLGPIHRGKSISASKPARSVRPDAASMTPGALSRPANQRGQPAVAATAVRGLAARLPGQSSRYDGRKKHRMRNRENIREAEKPALAVCPVAPLPGIS